MRLRKKNNNMTKCNIKDLLENENAPIIKAIYVHSSNCQNDQVDGYAVQSVIEKTESQRLLFLKEFVKSGVDFDGKIDIINGFNYASTINWTVVDKIVDSQKKYDKNERFEVMWLEESYFSSEYHGNAGYTITTRRGIVLSYPNEL